MIDKYLTYLHEKEKEVKIHPKRKTASSWALAGPLDDIAATAVGGSSLLKKGPILPKIRDVVVGTAVMMSLFEIYRLVRSFFDKCTRDCGRFKMNNPGRQLCMLNCKRSSLEKQISLLIKNKQPEKAKETQSKLAVVNKKIVLYHQYLKKGK